MVGFGESQRSELVSGKYVIFHEIKGGLDGQECHGSRPHEEAV